LPHRRGQVSRLSLVLWRGESNARGRRMCQAFHPWRACAGVQAALGAKACASLQATQRDRNRMLPQTRGSCSLCRVDSHDAQQVVSTYPQDHSLPRYHSEASGRAIISDPTGQAYNANPSDLSSCCRPRQGEDWRRKPELRPEPYPSEPRYLLPTPARSGSAVSPEPRLSLGVDSGVSRRDP
jgi:hypothetical protein